MSTVPPPPSREQVEQKFLALLGGRASRHAVDRWAAQWVAAEDDGVDDPVVWWALNLLFGVDSTHGPNEPFLHPEEQIAGWLEEFRQRCLLD